MEMAHHGPILSGVLQSNRSAVADFLKNPTLCSETLVRRTMEKAGGQGFNIKDVQRIVEAHLTVLSEAVRKGESID